MKVTKEQIIIIVLGILCLIFGFIAFHRENNAISSEILKEQIETLNKQNDSLLSAVGSRDLKNVVLKKEIDSLMFLNDSLSKKKSTNNDKIKIYENFKSPNFKSSADSMRKLLSENGFN